LVDPHLLAELSTDVRETFGTVEAESLEAAITEHFEDLRVFCKEEEKVSGVLKCLEEGWRWAEVDLKRTLAFFFKSQFALLVVVLVLSSTTIFASLRVVSSVVARRGEPWLR
jgi:hypothetical protein